VLALLLIPLVAGCDIAVGVYFATKKKSSHGASVQVGPAVDTTFSIWVANLSAGVLTDAQVQTNIHNNGGQPTGEWTRVGGFTRSTEVDLALLPGPWDAILISATSNRKYLLDAVVVLNASGDPIASFTAPTTNELMLTPAEAENLPDGKTSETDAIAGQNSFIFKRFSGPVAPLVRFRVDIWDMIGGPTSGDTAWRSTIAVAGEQRSGGMGVFTALGVEKSYVSLRNVVSGAIDVIEVNELSATGSFVQNVALQSNVTGKVGAPSLSVATDGDIVVAHSVGSSDLRVRRFDPTLVTTRWNQPIVNGGGTAARVEPNSLSLDSANNAILVGGYDFGGLTGFGHYMQRLRASDGALWGSTPAPPADLANSYWRGVVASGTDDIFAAGDFSGPLPSTSLDVFTRKTSQSSTGAETWRSLQNGANNLADCGNAVGVDSGGNIYVGGFITITGPKKTGTLQKLSSAGVAAGAPWPLTLTGSSANATADTEILSLVVEGTTVYITGYETTATQGQNIFVMKIDVSGNPLVLWRRTFHGGSGDDRGVSLKTTPTHVFVSGDIDVGGGDFDIFVWKLLK